MPIPRTLDGMQIETSQKCLPSTATSTPKHLPPVSDFRCRGGKFQSYRRANNPKNWWTVKKLLSSAEANSPAGIPESAFAAVIFLFAGRINDASIRHM
jgi:hypothetical protein